MRAASRATARTRIPTVSPGRARAPTTLRLRHLPAVRARATRTGIKYVGQFQNGMFHGKGTLIAGHTLPGYQAIRFKPLEHRRKGGRLHCERLGNSPKRPRAVFPKRQHDQILRVGQVQYLQHRPVGADNAPRCHRKGETQLPLQEQVLGKRLLRRLSHASLPGISRFTRYVEPSALRTTSHC